MGVLYWYIGIYKVKSLRFPKVRPFWGPNIQDCSILVSVLGSLYLRKLPHISLGCHTSS